MARPLDARRIAVFSVAAAALALAVALGSERWGGLVPCALCLLERWPYRVAIVLGLVALLLPPRPARWVLGLLLLAVLAAVVLAGIHVGVEQGLWPSPLPECAGPRFTAGTIAQRLAEMPVHPAKPCDAPTYLIPSLPLSMAAMNLIFALAFALALAISLVRGARARTG
jgi:disulfide bond formation protein DsbB